MQGASSASPKIVKVGILHYPKKEWFVYVCGLSSDGLIPGKTLTEEHVSKKECESMFGGMVKGHNGYKVRDLNEFHDRIRWLWKRTHQEDGAVNDDFGLNFAQGLLFEYWGRGKVDCASFAVRLCTWFLKTSGVKAVHTEFKWAHPRVAIDWLIGQPVLQIDPTCKYEKIQEATLSVESGPPVPAMTGRGSKA